MKLLFATVFILWAFSAPGRARAIQNWSYEQLFTESDLVVIAEPLATMTTKDTYEHDGYKREDYTGLDTRFQILSLLKGKVPSENFTVLHFCYSKRAGLIVNGALFVHFRLKSRTFEGRIYEGDDKKGGLQAPSVVSMKWPKPNYLLFLKLRPDGRFEPVTGQYDATLSCREMLPAENAIFQSED